MVKKQITKKAKVVEPKVVEEPKPKIKTREEMLAENPNLRLPR